MHLALMKQTQYSKGIKVSQAAQIIRQRCRALGKPYPSSAASFLTEWRNYNISARFKN